MPLRPQHFSVEKKMDDLSISTAWELLGNTEHLNRTIGLPAITYGEVIVSETDFYREASAKALGLLTTRYREYPFEWIRDQRYAVQRIFENGPFIRFYGGVELKPEKVGCVVCVFADITPRHRFGALVASIIGRKGVRDTLRYCEDYLKLFASGIEDALPGSRGKTPVARENLDRLFRTLAEPPIRPELLARLNQRLSDGTDEEVLRMRPFAIARKWGEHPYEVLYMFLHATKAGLVNLTWELMCPNCRVPKAEYNTLTNLSNEFHCETCGINYKANFDRYVELRFSVHPRVRKAVDQVYCNAGPYHAPHILAQHYLDPGVEQVFSVPLGDDGMRFRVSRYNDVALLSALTQSSPSTRSNSPPNVPQSSEEERDSSSLRSHMLRQTGEVAEAQTKLQVAYRDDGWQPQALTYIPGPTSIEIKNESSKPILAILEKVEWDTDAVTAVEVTALQEFRDLFGSEVLAPGQQVGIESLSIFFSDLKNSTPLYELVGDARAYGMVRRHFDFLIEVITKNHGAIVKTIGDAVMAVFYKSEDAVLTALEIQERVSEFNRENQIEPPIIIKIGVYHGPVIAVNSNERLDYFGRTVNIAARIQPQSVGGDVVITADFCSEPSIQEVLKRFNFEVEPFRTTLKGIEEEFELCRLTLKPESEE